MDMQLELTKKANVVVPASRSAGTVESSAVDTAGFDEIIWTLAAGAITDTIASVNLHVEESANGSSGWVDITGAAIVALGGTSDDAIPTIGIRLGGRAAGTRQRYQRAVLVIAGTGTVLCGVTCDLCKPHEAPVTNTPASVLV